MDFLAGEKRPVETDELEIKDVKRVKGEILGKVAEMVLVLSAMGKIRGGKSPSVAERGLMEEARGKLVEVCEGFKPKDVFPVEGVGGLIEDLGLEDLKEGRLGFRPPKLSVYEKMLISKRKFQSEKAEEFALPPATSSQKLTGPAITTLEKHGLPQQVQVTPQDKSFQVSVPSASQQPAAVFGHVSATKSTHVPYQFPISEFRSTVPNALPSSQVQAHSSRNQAAMRTMTWPIQPQNVSSTQMVSQNKVPLRSDKVDGSMVTKSGITPQLATTKPVTTQVTTGATPILHQNISSMNVGKPPHMRNTHSEISNMVQKLLQRYVEHSVWTPPSRDYLNRPCTCQMCQSSVTDEDSLLICDNCERGYHLKCLQTANYKRDPKGEWHCFRCLTASRGKPIPPKYGRVMRNTNNTKIISNTAPVRPSPDGKTTAVNEKPNLQKVSSNGHNSMQTAPSASTGNISIQPALTTHNNDIVTSKGEMDVKHSPGTCLNNSTGAHVVSSGQPNEEKLLVDLRSKSLVDSEKVPIMGSNSERLDQHSKDKGALQSCLELPSDRSVDNNIIVTDSSEHCVREASSHSNKELEGGEFGVLTFSLAHTATTTSNDMEASKSSSIHSDVVDWVGAMFEVADERRIYYQACCISGVLYRINDYVLVRFEDGKLTPSKLQVMWEDCKTKSKWFTVNRCYFPTDLPDAVGRPCGLESNEVYESTRGSTIMAGLIQGPCNVLPQNKFDAVKERRASSGTEGDVGLRPYYLCKWIYDESKGVFRDISY